MVLSDELPTFATRVAALDPLGFPPRQAAFLVTALLHAGVCLRRQYFAFTNTTGGQHTREFLEELVARRLAERASYARDHRFVYHLTNRKLYRLIGEPETRSQRRPEPPVIARRLMLLDLAIALPQVRWCVTEREKVAYCRSLNIPDTALPQRTYAAHSPTAMGSTIRYFVHKLPWFVTPDGRPTLVCPFQLPGTGEVTAFLREHTALLQALPRPRVLVTGPRALANDMAVRNAFLSFFQDTTGWRVSAADAAWVTRTNALVETGQIGQLSLADIRRLRDLRSRLASARHKDAAAPATPPDLEIHWLPFHYPG